MGYRPDGIYELPMSEANRRGVRWRQLPRSARSAFHTDSGSPLAATHNWGERNLRDSS
jgi:hypothetical protein